MYLKQANDRVQTLLEHWVEPWCSLAWLQGMDYPAGFLRLAWKTLLQCHPHDSICGCGTDRMHREMMHRFSQCEQIAEECLFDAMYHIAQQATARRVDKHDSALAVFNAHWSTGDALITADIDFPVEARVTHFAILDGSRSVPFHVEASQKHLILHDKASPMFPGFKMVDRYTVTMLASDVPGYGVKWYRVVPRRNAARARVSLSQCALPLIVENSRIRLTFHRDGSFDLDDKPNRLTYRRLNIFEDSGDAGDEYNYCPPLRDRVISTAGSRAAVVICRQCRNFTTVQIDHRLRVPARIDHGRRSRSRQTVVLPIRSYVTLHRTARRVEIRTELDNTAADHRLRVLFAAGVQATHAWADTPFDVIRRPIALEPHDDWFELPTPTHPQSSFVDVSDGRHGLMIAAPGLHEYEVKNDDDRTIALTLLRGVEWGSRCDLTNTRRGKRPDGQPEHRHGFMFTPEAQCLGPHTYTYALIPHAGDWTHARDQASSYRIGMRAMQVASRGGLVPAARRFLGVQPPAVVVSAVKRADDRNRLVVRLHNPLDRTVRVRLSLPGGIKQARWLDLRERPRRGPALTIRAGRTVVAPLGGRSVRTIEITQG
jgi:alpha-mannosidase